AGYIGLELAESMTELNKDVTIVEFLPQVMALFDADIAQPCAAVLKQKGVKLMLGTACQGLTEKEGVYTLETNNGSVEVDTVMFCVGVRPATKCLAGTGINLDPRGHVIVDKYLRTNVDSIYAIGDCAAIPHKVLPTNTPLPLAGPAAAAGRKVAKCIAHGVESMGEGWAGAIGCSIIRLWNFYCGNVGCTEKMLQRAEIPYTVTCSTWFSKVLYHPTPAPHPIHAKALFHADTGVILGAQAYGPGEGVARRLDVLSAYIQMGATMDNLIDFEGAYCPPVGAPRDVVNYLGMVSVEKRDGNEVSLLPSEVTDQVIVDVRTPQEYEGLGHPKNSINIPLATLRSRLDELPKGEFVVSCKAGKMSHIAYRMLVQKGYNVKNLNGGWFSFCRNKPGDCNFKSCV
ncbi:hypothetical protein KIPB_009850, partial [Kipferlia bialata]